MNMEFWFILVFLYENWLVNIATDVYWLKKENKKNMGFVEIQLGYPKTLIMDTKDKGPRVQITGGLVKEGGGRYCHKFQIGVFI